MRYEFRSEPRGEAYRELLRFCADICARVLLVVREVDWLDESALTLLDELRPFQIAVAQQSEWPGTTLVKDTATVYTYTVCDEVVAVLQASAEGLYEWRQPTRPEDPCFLRKTNEPVLVTIAHERDSYLDISDSEFELLVSRFQRAGTLVRPSSDT